jgi:hypothetical protein
MLFMLLAMLLAVPVHAQGRGAGPRATPARTAPRGQGVEVRMMVVYATDAHQRVDPRLQRLQRYLSNLRFTGFEIVGSHRASLLPKGSRSFSIDGGRKVIVELLSRDDRKARMRVQIVGQRGVKLLDTTLSVNRNGTFIVAGPKYRDGILVLPLSARY